MFISWLARKTPASHISHDAPSRTARSDGSCIVISSDSNAAGASSFVSMVYEGGAASLRSPSFDSQRQQGLTVWFTGLSGAGKTTICNSVYTELSTRGYRVEMLDADMVRKQLWPDLGFSKKDRDDNIRRLGFLAQLLTRNGIIALVAAISPYRAARDEVRNKILRFLEVHVDAPLEVCEERDPKGLYRRARSGELHGFTGIDDPYETPLAPEIRCATALDTVESCRDQVVSAVLSYLS
jgi:adenylylsulfate kinase